VGDAHKIPNNNALWLLWGGGIANSGEEDISLDDIIVYTYNFNMKENINHRLDRALAARWTERRTVHRRKLKEMTPHVPVPRGATPRGDRPLTPEQWAVLQILDGAGLGVTVQTIAGQCDFPHANATRTLDRLEKRGLIMRLRNKADRRRVMVHLTVEGKRMVRDLDAVEDSVHHVFWDIYGPEEKELLLQLLTRRVGPANTSSG
jgi:DNA-binding MarR family transcriptional regulator